MSQNGIALEVAAKLGAFQDALAQRAKLVGDQFRALLHEQRQIEYKVQKLREYVVSLNGLLEAEGLAPITLREPGSTGFAAPGNRAQGMPVRKPDWEGMSIQDAIAQILSLSDTPMHANELVDAIYEINSQVDHARAKRSLTSSARAGVKSDRWMGLPRNTYASLQVGEAFALAQH